MAKTLVHTVIDELQHERGRLEHELRRITAALAAFGKVYRQGNTSVSKVARRKHKISAEGRKRIAAAQRARWAKARAGKK